MYALPSAVKACAALAALVAAASVTSEARLAPTPTAASQGAEKYRFPVPAAQTTSPLLLPPTPPYASPADPADPATAAATLADSSAAAALLEISPADLRARGLEPETCPHNITYENRDRRELAGEGWRAARATWYGGPGGPGPDGMSIYRGSCGFGHMSNHFVSAWQGGAHTGPPNK